MAGDSWKTVYWGKYFESEKLQDPRIPMEIMMAGIVLVDIPHQQ